MITDITNYMFFSNVGRIQKKKIGNIALIKAGADCPDHMQEIVDFFKEMGIKSKFEDGILQIEYVPNEAKVEFEEIIRRERFDVVLMFGKPLKIKYPAHN